MMLISNHGFRPDEIGTSPVATTRRPIRGYAIEPSETVAHPVNSDRYQLLRPVFARRGRPVGVPSRSVRVSRCSSPGSADKEMGVCY